MNLGYCHCDPNGQHLALWQSFQCFGVGRMVGGGGGGGGGGVRWVFQLLTPRAAQLSQLLPLSSFLICPPYPSASSALQIYVASIRRCRVGFALPGGSHASKSLVNGLTGWGADDTDSAAENFQQHP